MHEELVHIHTDSGWLTCATEWHLEMSAIGLLQPVTLTRIVVAIQAGKPPIIMRQNNCVFWATSSPCMPCCPIQISGE